MTMLFELLQFPFMQRALLAGAMLAAVLASLGVIATLRNMAFFGEGVAHASLAGIAFALVLGLAPLPLAILWAILIAVAIYFLERSTKLSSDSLIGILFTTSMAIGVILMSYTQGYQPELISFLFGSILAVRDSDLLIIAAGSIVILSWFALSLRHLVFSSFSEDTATVAGVPVKRQTLLFYMALAIATVLGVKILGIILVSALVVLPPATSRIHARSFKQYLWRSILLSEGTVLLGLILSFMLDLPSGAVIVIIGSFFFFLFSLLPRANHARSSSGL